MGKTTRRWISLGNGPDSISVAWKAPVLAVAATPTSSNESDRFIVGATPSGDFAEGPVNSIATRYSGAWWFEVCSAGDAVIDLGTGNLLAYSGAAWVDKGQIIGGGGGADLSLMKWRDPVGALVDALPATCTTGDRVILSTDKKIYTATGANTWGTGVMPENSWALVCGATDKIYVYDADSGAWVVIGDGGTVPDATAASKGVVSVPSGSGLAVTAGAVSLVRHEFRESVTLTAGDISSKGITLSKVPTAGQEAATRVNVIGGLYAPYGTDYVVTGTSLSWNALGLDGLLQAGDTIDVSYWTDEA